MSASRFTQVRPPAVAGTFYPQHPDELRRLVQFCLAGGRRTLLDPRQVKAQILPHAGLIYSGPIAGTGYLLLEKDCDSIKRVILLGPSHRLAFDGIAISNASKFATPLGEVSVDEAAVEEISELPGVELLEAAHAREHSLEVHLPFLQTVLPSFTLVPLVVGNASEETVSAVLEKLWGGPETRLIISSDLSHYFAYAEANRLDTETAARIEHLKPVGTDQACGAIPLNGLLRSARQHHLKPHTLDLRNSGDTAGSRDRVVGYGAFAFALN